MARSRHIASPRGRNAITLGDYLTNRWLPERQRRVRAGTAYRYGWTIERYIVPTVGRYALRSIRTDHLNGYYTTLTATGHHRERLATKPGHKVHLIVRSALTQTTEQGLTRTNIALRAQRLRPHACPASNRYGPPPSSPPFLNTADRHRGVAVGDWNAGLHWNVTGT